MGLVLRAKFIGVQARRWCRRAKAAASSQAVEEDVK